MAYRTKDINGDYMSRNPKTQRYCCVCQKDIKPGKPARMVHLVDGGPFALHSEDEKIYEAEGDKKGDMLFFYIGPDCAKRLGLEWSTTEPSETPSPDERKVVPC